MVFAWRSHALVIGAVTFIVMGGGVALGARLAAIPGSDGVIHGCYNEVNGQLRVVESATDCKNNELAIQWNQSGPAGASGAAGAAGAAGTSGATGATGQSNPIAEADTGRFVLPCGPFFCLALTDELYVSNAGDTNAHNLTSLATTHVNGTEFLVATGHCQIQGPNTVYVSIEDVSNSVTVVAFVGPNNRYAKLLVPAITANV